MVRKAIILFFVLTVSTGLSAQLGGKSTYAFLNLTNSARVASMGGKMISTWDDDLNLTFHNPSLLHDEMSNQLVVNYVNYFSDINFGYVSYANNFKKLGNMAFGLHYINYGDFVAADETGFVTGKFSAAEYALNLIWAKSLDSLFHFGVNVKPVYSVMESYRSYGLLADVGLTYLSRDKLFTAAAVIRNMGYQIKPYHDGNREKMPLEVQLGISQKLKHAPFRFSIIAHNLQQPDLSYSDPSNPDQELDPISGETVEQNKLEKFGDNFMKHIIFGIEFTPIQNFYLRGGYNYLRRSELKVDSRVAMVGFSWGFGLKISKFHLSYGRATYHLAGASNHFSISTNFSSFYRKVQ